MHVSCENKSALSILYGQITVPIEQERGPIIYRLFTQQAQQALAAQAIHCGMIPAGTAHGLGTCGPATRCPRPTAYRASDLRLGANL